MKRIEEVYMKPGEVAEFPINYFMTGHPELEHNCPIVVDKDKTTQRLKERDYLFVQTFPFKDEDVIPLINDMIEVLSEEEHKLWGAGKRQILIVRRDDEIGLAFL